MPKRAAKRTKQQPAVQKKSAKIALIVDANVPSYYVNYVEIGHSRHEFSMMVARTPVKPTPEQMQQIASGNPLTLEAFVHLTFAPTFLPLLIKALETQKARFEQKIGPIPERQAQE